MGEARFFEAFFLGKVVRAAREGYVDLDPIHDKAPLQGFVHPRNEFLDLRDAARTLCRAATAGSVHKVMEMSGRAQAIVRSLPDPSVETARPGFGA